jgi:hypothetical protein
LDEGDDGVFVAFAVHEGEGVVVLEHDRGDVEAPDVEQGGVDDVGKGGLGIVGDVFLEGLFF